MNKIGLKRDTVKLEPHNKRWVLDFEKEKKNLRKILGGKAIAIEHIGSTSIPGIAAKPIIDVMVGVKSIKKDGRQCVKLLTKHKGYYWRPNYFSQKKRLLVAKGSEISRTHYIHILRFNGITWKKNLAFRNYLRDHKSVAIQYAKIKERTAREHGMNRSIYTEAKSPFVRKIIKKALQYHPKIFN